VDWKDFRMFVLFKGVAVRKKFLFSSQIFLASTFAVDSFLCGEGEIDLFRSQVIKGEEFSD
jgi:hypothetical protein